MAYREIEAYNKTGTSCKIVHKDGVDDIIIDSTELGNGLAAISEIGNVQNGYDFPKTAIDKLLSDANKGLKSDVTYIVTGDSTRHNDFNEMIPYYEEQLAKISVNVVNNSASGQTALDWLNNTDQVTINQCMDACMGEDGENTIIEFSFGINDAGTGAGDYASLKARIKDCIDAIFLAKPRVNLVLATPVPTNGSVDNFAPQVYSDLASEYGLQLVDTTINDVPRNNNPKFAHDTTHPNKYGSRRLVNYILNEIVPEPLKIYMTMEDMEIKTPPTPIELGDGLVSDGYWNTGTGNLEGAGSDWRRTTNKIAVEPNFIVQIAHNGNQWAIVFFDENENFLESVGAGYVDVGLREVTVPTAAWYMAFNITSDVNSYPDTTFSVKYKIDKSGWLSVDEINENLTLGFPRQTHAYVSKGGYKASIEDVDFIQQGKNLFDKDNLIVNKYLPSNGYEGDSDNYSYTNTLVEVKPSTVYHTNVDLRYIMTYDKNMKRVYPSVTPSSVAAGTFVTNPTAKYVKFTIYNTADINTVQIEEGEIETSYEAFGYDIVLPNGKKVRL